MEDKNKHLEDLAAIRNMMEKSSKFMSLSGLSGVAAGVIAILGAFVAIYIIKQDIPDFNISNALRYMKADTALKLMVLGLIILVLAFLSALYFTSQKAKLKKESIWNGASKNMVSTVSIPMISGGVLSLILIHHELYILVPPITLLFYGLSCVMASFYTLHEIKYLGISNIILGLINVYFLGYGLVFWAIGFGIMHIVYGAVMYLRHERK